MRQIHIALIALALSTSCAPAAATAPTSAEPSAERPIAMPSPRSPAPTVIWAAPAAIPSAPTAAPTPAPTIAAVVTPRPPAAPPSPRRTISPSPSIKPSPRPSLPSATPSLLWQGFKFDTGTLLVVPDAWVKIDPAAVKGMFGFAAASDPPASKLMGHDLLLTLTAVKTGAPMTVDAWADSWSKVLTQTNKVARARIVVSSGPAVLLTYNVPGGTRRHTDAMLVAGSRGYILGFEAPAKDWDNGSSLLRQILNRFEPAS